MRQMILGDQGAYELCATSSLYVFLDRMNWIDLIFLFSQFPDETEKAQSAFGGRENLQEMIYDYQLRAVSCELATIVAPCGGALFGFIVICKNTTEVKKRDRYDAVPEKEMLQVN